MSSLIQELENNEALLLMYFTDELPAQDRVEVEQMLANDAGMRAALAQIEVAYNASMGALAILDADRSAEPAENHAVRQASRAMKQWQVDRLARQPMVIPTPRTRVPLWAYPVGVAAMLLIGSLIWWGGQADRLATTTGSAPVAAASDNGVASNTDNANPVEDPTKTNLLESSLTGEVATGSPDTESNISNAERQARTLIARSDEDSVTSSIFMRDANQ